MEKDLTKFDDFKIKEAYFGSTARYMDKFYEINLDITVKDFLKKLYSRDEVEDITPFIKGTTAQWVVDFKGKEDCGASFKIVPLGFETGMGNVIRTGFDSTLNSKVKVTINSSKGNGGYLKDLILKVFDIELRSYEYYLVGNN